MPLFHKFKNENRYEKKPTMQKKGIRSLNTLGYLQKKDISEKMR